MDVYFKKTSVILTSILLASLATTAQAKYYNYNEQAADLVFTGIVQSKPIGGLHGIWLIAETMLRTNVSTHFNQQDGRLRVGACVKVELRNGKVHEIDSEPAHNC